MRYRDTTGLYFISIPGSDRGCILLAAWSREESELEQCTAIKSMFWSHLAVEEFVFPVDESGHAWVPDGLAPEEGHGRKLAPEHPHAEVGVPVSESGVWGLGLAKFGGRARIRELWQGRGIWGPVRAIGAIRRCVWSHGFIHGRLGRRAMISVRAVVFGCGVCTCRRSRRRRNSAWSAARGGWAPRESRRPTTTTRRAAAA